MNKPVRNLAASVHNRLVARARERREDAGFLLTRYANERFLYRLSLSPHRDQFVLKGATLFTIWQDAPHRPTRDMDFLGCGDASVQHALSVFRDICQVPVEDDGLVFPPERVAAAERREDEVYGGLHVDVVALMGSAVIPLQIDIGFGDAITPAPEESELPVLLDFPRPRIWVYPRETVVAEKLEAAVSLGLTNSRMKDFYDLWYLATNFTFEGPPVAAAITATFARRGTSLPAGLPLALSEEFAADTGKQAQWNAFLRRGKLGDSVGLPLSNVVMMLRGFLLPPMEAVRARNEFSSLWSPAGPWIRSGEAAE